MSAEKGGRADKLGNRYERKWVVLQMLRVIAGDCSSIVWEAAGPDERGVDLWATTPDGSRWGHQCKRSNGSHGKWSIADLRDVLQKARIQLDSSPSVRFALVSGDKAPELEDLVDRTRRCDRNPRLFVDYLTATSRNHAGAFRQLCSIWELNPSTDDGCVKLYDYLSRMEVVLFGTDHYCDDLLRLHARCCIDGDAATAVSMLESLAADSLGNSLDAEQISRHLQKHGLPVRRLSTAALAQRVANLQERFARSINCLLINDRLINRHETQVVLEQIGQANGPQITCIHGAAGHGKSGVLYELASLLHDRGVPYLPLRLDRHAVAGDPDQFGRSSCGLPTSPGACLKAIAGSKPAVLILDQLDALRWTSAHSAEAWDVCEEMITEAACLPNIHIVVACRTFDWREDPRIKMLAKRFQVAEVAVQPLDEAVVKETVEHLGQSFDTLTGRQKVLLGCPQTLYLWYRLRQCGKAGFRFNTSTDLMRGYWKYIRTDGLASVCGLREDVEALVSAMVETMDSTGRLTCPYSVLERWPDALSALLSLDVIAQDENERVLFRHQSHLDYLVASRVHAEASKGGRSVVDWIKDKEQSLFRREQLRVVLALLRDDDPAQYVQAIRSLLESEGIRFHLKHLALGCLRQSDPPINEEIAIVLEYLARPEWKEHVIGQVLWNQAAWFKVLAHEGRLQAWLKSANPEDYLRALTLMQLVMEHCGDEVVDVIQQFSRVPVTWAEHLPHLFTYSNGCKESRRAFALRLKLIRQSKALPEHLDLDGLAKSEPLRCLTLLRACLTSFLQSYRAHEPTAFGRDLPEFKALYPTLSKDIASAAGKHARAYWIGITKSLQPHSEMINAWQHKSMFRDEMLMNDHGIQGVLWIIEMILAQVGSEWVRQDTHAYLKWLSEHFESEPALVRRAALVALAAADVEQYSDSIIGWVSNRFAECMSSRITLLKDVVARFSPACGETSFARLEIEILESKAPDLKSSYTWQATSLKAGRITGNEYGRFQHVLLSAIPRERLSLAGIRLLGQLDEKFRLFPFRPGLEHGFSRVSSPIPSEALPRVSDKQWLAIMSRDWPAANGRWRQIGPRSVGEASHQHFASDLGHAAYLDPQRFARLALRIPSTSPSNYLEAILSALGNRNPPTGRDPTNWEPASQEAIERVLAHVGYATDHGIGMAFCRLLSAWPQFEWSKPVLGLLIKYATEHPHPKPDEYTSHSYGGQSKRELIPDVHSSSINCVRGCAADTVMDLLFRHKKWLSILRPAVEHLVEDPSPPVRLAAFGTCLAVWSIDRNLALDLFMKACSMQDDRIFLGHYASHFISCIRDENLSIVAPVIDRMSRSQDPRVSSTGAGWIGAIWIERGERADQVESLLGSHEHHRKGLAEVAANWFDEPQNRPRCRHILRRLYADPNENVRLEASSLFHNESLLKAPEAVDVCMDFLRSQAFGEDPEPLLSAMRTSVGSLRPFTEVIFAISDLFAGPLAEKSRDYTNRLAYQVRELQPIMLRLYEQSQDLRDSRTQIRCLDAWDALLKARVGGIYDIASEIS